MIKIKKYLLRILSIATIGSLVFYVPIKYKQEKLKSPWVTIFIHGSFGSPFAIFDATKVLQDKIDKTKYKKIVKKMRQDPFFYQLQPMLKKGLVQVTPTFDLKETEGKKFSAYPIAKAYEIISQYVNNINNENLFYTFGWSGLLSQKQRRIEAIKLYNALNKELQQLKAKGVKPKLRIIAHSHGGNLVANIASINETLEQLKKTKFVSTSSLKTSEQFKTIKNMHDVLKVLPTQKNAIKQFGPEATTYIPTKSPIIIDELVLYGTPIQKETAHLFLSQTFKKTYNFYSNNDNVQVIDAFSTKNFYSSRRFDNTQKKSNITQARIIFDTKTKNKSNWWGKLLSKANNGPTHKELWLCTWEKKEKENSLNPLPISILTPLFTKIIDKKLQTKDVDLNIQLNSQNVSITLTKHNESIPKKEILLPIKIISDLKKQIKLWKPDNFSLSVELNAISKHCKKY